MPVLAQDSSHEVHTRDYLQGGSLVRQVNLQENILQIEQLPCGNFTIVVSQDRDGFPQNVRLSLLLGDLVLTQVAIRSSDPNKLDPANLLFDYEYRTGYQGENQLSYLWICLNQRVK